MNSAWNGTLEQASTLVAQGTFLQAVTAGFERAYGWVPGQEEVGAWQTSLPPTLAALQGVVSPEVELVVEYKLPFNGQRADLVILGSSPTGSEAHVVELKHWAESKEDPNLEHFVRVQGKATPHPSYQAANYAGKLHYFHSVAQNWHVGASAYVLDRSDVNHAALRSGKYAELWTAAPVFLPGESHAFARYVSERIQRPLSYDQVTAFLNGTYSQSLTLLEGIARHKEAILKRAMGALAVTGWGLSDEQLEIYDTITRTVSRGDTDTFLLSGGPGSGKTLLAVHLLLALARAGKRTILAVRNNRLNAVLKKVIEIGPLGKSGVIKYFSTPGRDGVEDGNNPVADVLICDEAQRLGLKSENVFSRAPVTVILYDEDQILNLEECGTNQNFRQLPSKAGGVSKEYHLPTLHRCRGGKAYVEWIELLLRVPGAMSKAQTKWDADYVFEVFSSPRGMIDALVKMRGAGKRVALVAAFTRSSGRDKTSSAADLGKVRIPEVDPPVTWLMDPVRDYVPFWLQGKSSELTHCASIYGSQGFETDCAGVIWGDDLVIRDGDWQVGDWRNSYDVIGRPTLQTLMRQGSQDALRLLKNRYRILLTRGILGTMVYSEDPETQRFLTNLSSS